MFSLNKLSMSYGQKLLFYDVDLTLNTNTRYALVGANGSGKSTFLKLITGEEESLSGTVSYPKDAIIGWLKQDQFRYEDTAITDIVIQGKPQLWQALFEKEQLLAATEWDDQVGHRLGELEEVIGHYNGYSAEALAEKLLVGLGVHPDYHRQPLKALSGGFKLRVLLAQALFQEPDILLLDEPTNHLDITSIAWLEKYLRTEFPGLLVFISHDMEFINRLADYILDIDYGDIRQYSGYYHKFLAEKKLVEEQVQHTKKLAEKRIAELQGFINRFGASATKAKQAQSRAKMIEKIEIPDVKHSSRIAPYFHFKPHRPSGKQVLRAMGLSKNYDEKKIFSNINLQILRGEKIAVIGANGMGKSTLIKVLLNKTDHQEGNFEWGYETHINYFSQDHHDLLDKHQSVLTWMSEQVTNHSEQNIRKTLGQVLFTKDEIEKDILSISGGEAARLLLAKISLESGNVLILDEPTNHLDLEATEALVDALVEYKGTLIFVSHNRHFIDKIANRILYISPDKKLKDFKGKYTDFEKTLQ
jgi:ATPase subunit of ABC transporter with duplicated ATPase domains